MLEAVVLRRLAAADLRDFKALRDRMLERYPEAFTSDAGSERGRRADDYLPRLGLDRPDGGHLVLGAWHDSELLGAIGLERDRRDKVRHIGHVIGMLVKPEAQRQGVGRALLEAAIAEARAAGLELLTLSVTAGNSGALRLYEQAGFERYGTLRKALRIGDRYLAKVHMALEL
jgi:ribosomal protein S18 acetylase RimI-like enzyme